LDYNPHPIIRSVLAISDFWIADPLTPLRTRFGFESLFLAVDPVAKKLIRVDAFVS
jgi:hypothetical protein